MTVLRARGREAKHGYPGNDEADRDTREEWPASTEVGAWAGGEFVRMIQRHMMRKQKYPDEGPATGRPYDGIENLRPETKAAVEAFLVKQSSPTK